MRPAWLPSQAAGPGRDWTVDAVLELAKTGLAKRNFDNGRKSFAAARCIVCHRFAGDGGATGPDLTQAAGRFGVKDMTEAMLVPSKVVSDQYKSTNVQTTGGNMLTGRLLETTNESITILVDPENPTKFVSIPRGNIDEMAPSTVSLMPADLLKTLNADEVLDLLAYLLSRGNPNDALFK